MTTQVDNTAQVDNSESYLYMARYCGPKVKRDDESLDEYRQRCPLRVEIRRQGDGPAIADVTWEEFKKLIPLGQELIKKCGD